MNSPRSIDGHTAGRPITTPRAKVSASALHAARPAVLMATSNTKLRDGLAELLQPAAVHTIWVSSLANAKRSLAVDNIAVCFCGFWLEGGTYRDIVESAASQASEIPLIVASVSSPAFAREYQHYFAALHIGAFDVIGHPCDRSKFKKVLDLALEAHFRSLPKQEVWEAGDISGIFPARASFFHSSGPGLSH